MMLTFCKKNEEFYEKYDKEYSFVYPSDEDIIAEYTIMEAIDRPIVGDLVKVRGSFYKVYRTMVDYDMKTVFAVINDLE